MGPSFMFSCVIILRKSVEQSVLCLGRFLEDPGIMSVFTERTGHAVRGVIGGLGFEPRPCDFKASELFWPCACSESNHGRARSWESLYPAAVHH